MLNNIFSSKENKIVIYSLSKVIILPIFYIFLSLMKNFIFKNKKKYYSHYIYKLVLQERLLFIDWINRFDTNNHIWDEWELLNPPSVTASAENNEFNDNNFDIDTFFDAEH